MGLIPLIYKQHPLSTHFSSLFILIFATDIKLFVRTKVITVRARLSVPPIPLRKEIETITTYKKIDDSTIIAVQVRSLVLGILAHRLLNCSVAHYIETIFSCMIYRDVFCETGNNLI